MCPPPLDPKVLRNDDMECSVVVTLDTWSGVRQCHSVPGIQQPGANGRYSVSSIVTLTAGKYSHQLGCEYIHCIRVQARVRMK